MRFGGGPMVGANIIPLQCHGHGADSRRSHMFSKPFLKSRFLIALLVMLAGLAAAPAQKEAEGKEPEVEQEVKKEEKKPGAEPEEEKKDGGVKPEDDGQTEAGVEDEAVVEEAEAEAAAVARPVSADPIQVYGWREKILIDGMEKGIYAKLDTGAYTSSIHAEEKELFERDGKKWVRFIVTEPRKKGSPRIRIEAPLVRIARIKEPGGETETREVVRLAFKIGDRKLRGDFTLNNRSNMLSIALIGRTTIKQLGWIDPSRTNLADDKIMR